MNEYILICNYDNITKETLLNGYTKENFNIIYNEKEILLLKKDNTNLNDKNEELLLDLFVNMLKKFNIQKPITADLSSDFKHVLDYMSKHTDITHEKNKTTWYIRQIISKLLAK